MYFVGFATLLLVCSHYCMLWILLISESKINVDHFDKGLETILGDNLKAFQRYIENCVKPTDLIAFYKKFSFGKVFSNSSQLPHDCIIITIADLNGFKNVHH